MIKKGFLITFFTTILLLLMCLTVNAEEAVYNKASFVINGFDNPALIHDDSKATYSESYQLSNITVKSDSPISAVYIIFDTLPGKWTVTEKTGWTSAECGEKGFLHEFVDLSELFGETEIKELKIEFWDEVTIAEVYVFSEGEIPSWVQQWDEPSEKVDLMMLVSHAGDEHLFFAGVLPYYAVEKQKNVQVVYIVNYYNNRDKSHEILDGLWEVGVRNYPVFGSFPDIDVEADDRTEAKNAALASYERMGYTFDSFVEFITLNIRRFKPLVILSHDTDGENGNGTHVLCTDAIAAALDCSMNSSKFPDSIETYGTWMADKVYFHSYPSNVVTFDFDTPYESLGGRSPFAVSQDGFKCHKSQLWKFGELILGKADSPITKATEVKEYSPCNYGLYFSNVGEDKIGGDFFENVVAHPDRTSNSSSNTVGTLPQLDHTLPDELAVESVTFAENESEKKDESKQSGEEKNNDTLIIALILIGTIMCVITVLAAVSANKTNVRAKRMKKLRKRDGKLN